MWTVDNQCTTRPRLSYLRVLAISLIAFGAGTACNRDLLSVSLPTKVSSSALDNPQLAQTLVNSAVGEFECAFSSYVSASGQMTDELRHSSSWLTMTIWDELKIDQDNGSSLCTTSNGNGVFIPMQKARALAEDSKTRFEGWSDADVPNRATLIATVATYAGFARTILGESFCDMTFDVGPLLTPTQALATADSMFTVAIAAAQKAGSAEYLNMALVGRARVRMDLGNKAGAKTDAQAVPQGFKKVANYSSVDPYRYNRVYRYNYVDMFVSVSDEFRDLKFGGVPDPRVKVVLSPQRGHNQSLVYQQTKYTTNSPITIASYEEAQLIIAEADLGQSAVNIINALHTAVGLPAYVPKNGNDNAEILAQVIQERSRQLFLEGHRLQDFLRFKIPFPTGPSPYTGVTYGPTTCLPMVRAEWQSNPRLQP